MDLQTLFDKHHVSYKLGDQHRHVRHGWIGIDCPDCEGVGANLFHLGINLTSYHTTCWRCGYKRLGNVLSHVLRISLHEAINLVRELPQPKRIDPKLPTTAGKLTLPKGITDLKPPHRQYLERRGFNPDKLIKLWGIKGIGLAPELPWRIWIPIYWHGELVSWSTRTIGKAERKYLHAGPSREKVAVKDLLYGWDYIRHTIIICEGPADVWRIGPGAVAIMGLVVSDSQLDLIRSVPNRVVCFDNEPLAQRKANALALQFSASPLGFTVVHQLDSADPGEATAKEVEFLRRTYLD